ncbi:M24 family metallopeptidase [Roseibium aggregatum]|uniref:M24 family metallopeptidase n=1 Tax=Roseibium aggregatum TaxID=187304 RepID=A0A926NUT2_9HYPH|nr:M24 family metallopeptidase [Roseibium aggregatum]MBD1545624.1 M24 family metallopeptidase [Roseibium aggregatum]
MSADMDRIYEMENSEKAYLPFSGAEMDGRQSRLRKLMEARRIDACLFTSYHNICYFSGFLYCSFGRKYGFLVTETDATTISAGIDGGQPWRRTHGNALTYTDWRRDNYFFAIQSLLKMPNPSIKRIGIEFDHVSLDLKAQLEAALPSVDLVDIAADVMTQRTIKSAEEHVLIREGARICDIGGAATVEAIAAGVPEHEVAIASTNAMIREIAGSFPFVELMDTWTWFQSGINTDGAHNPVTNKKIEPGDILSLNCFPMIFGYYTALERTLFCEYASDAHLRLWEINCDVHRAGLKLIRPGVRCCDIASALNDIYRSHDLLKYRSFGYGHSFGVLSHYYGREASVELREDVETVLEPGMVVSMEPMIMVPEGQPGAGGYREHDILIVTETGAENITGFPFGPEHNIVAS